MMSNIKLVMLKTGENLVGDTSKGVDIVIIVNPLLMIPISQQQFGFAEYLQFTDEHILYLDSSDVRGIYEPKENIANYWNQHYGSGIITPTQKLITE